MNTDMKLVNIALCLMCLSYPMLAVSSQCPGSDAITDPPIFQWTHHPVGGGNNEEYYSGTLEIGEATFNIGGDTITTRAYRQEGGQYSIPGPTMYMVPGNKYVLRFKNTLPYEAPSADENVFKDPNISNVHTHGLHISGESPGDDVTRSFEGGYGGDFVYDIPADHMGGTFWYHAHHHGSTFLQVSGGAFGLIIIDDSADGIPVNVAGMEEKLLVLGFLDPAAAGTGGDTLIQGTLNSTWTVNGGVNGNLCVPTNTWQHWRVLVADRDAREKTVALGSQCQVALMARDGVWRTSAPLDLASNSVTITGASRADLAVRCTTDSELTVDGQVVANVFADGPTDSSVHPFAASGDVNGGPTWSAVRPAYLRDLRGVPNNQLNTETVSMGARTINGSRFDHHVPTFTVPTDQVQEWTVKGARQHPFHLHIYHVQMNGNCGNYEDGEYYDVIATNCDVRFDLNATTSTPYDGKTIMHCHILAHEDQGAMGWMDVQGGLAPPSFPDDSTSGVSFGEYFQFAAPANPPAAPSNLSATPGSSSQIDLAWTDNSSDEVEFEIERSDGSGFALVASVAADTESYSDTNLSASTTYDYRVNARNANGSSAYSNTATATTNGSGNPGTSITDVTVTVSTVNLGRGFKAGQAVVVVRDDQGYLVEGATVDGTFSGTFSEDTSGVTDANGSVTFETANSDKGSMSVTFCTTSVTHPSLDAYPGAECDSL